MVGFLYLSIFLVLECYMCEMWRKKKPDKILAIPISACVKGSFLISEHTLS